MSTIGHWLNNGAVLGAGRRRAPVYDPALGRTTGEVVLADVEDVDAAVNSGLEAFEGWSRTSLSRRTEVLFAFRALVHAHADELAALITSEHGKVLSDAKGEVRRGLDVIEYACGIPTLLKGEFSDEVSTGIDSHSFRSPLGVVCGITPFNFPMMVPSWMFPLAIACGNTFVLKPSERAPSTALRIGELFAAAGLPPGVFNVVQGDKVAVDALLEHPAVSAVSFVGSTPVARIIHAKATANGKRVQALGGAKNHAIVMPDSDPEYVAGQLVSAAFGSAGERCMAISAAITVGGSGESLLPVLKSRADAVRVGPGTDESSEMGPVISPEAQERIVGAVGAAERDGAEVVSDGRELRVTGYERGFFVGPTIVDGVQTNMDVYRTEVFGPVLSVMRADSVEDAVALVNANAYGNGTAIFTNAGGVARNFARSVKVGMVGINVPVPVPMAYHSFGGWKDSLFGERHIHGPEGIAFYTRAKVVTSRWPEAGTLRFSLDMPTGD